MTKSVYFEPAHRNNTMIEETLNRIATALETNNELIRQFFGRATSVAFCDPAFADPKVGVATKAGANTGDGRVKADPKRKTVEKEPEPVESTEAEPQSEPESNPAEGPGPDSDFASKTFEEKKDICRETLRAKYADPKTKAARKDAHRVILDRYEATGITHIKEEAIDAYFVELQNL